MSRYANIRITPAIAAIAALSLLLSLSGETFASQFHVSSGASSGGNGSSSSPWQFQTALNQPSAVRPGDTIWVHAGVYNGMFVSSLNGSAGSPIIVRNFQNDRVTIVSPGSWRDGIQVNGSYTWFWGLEVTSDPASPLDQPGSGFNIGIGSSGDGLKVINCVVHDQVGGGFGWWLPATNAEINGCVVYYNGREVGAGNNAHNYGIYMQNVSGHKLFKDNIDGYNWSYAAHVYSEQQGVDNFTLDGDVLYQSGYIWQNPNGGTFERNLIMGGAAAQGRDGDVVKDCHLYYSNTNNYLGGRLSIGYYSPMTNFSMTGTTVVGGTNEFSYSSGSVAGNTFINTTGDAPSGNTFTNSPSGTKIVVRPNDYELGRANVIVYNWAKNPSVSVDFSTFMPAGSTYTVRDAQNFFGPPVATGTYNGGTVSIPMNNTGVATPMVAAGQTVGAQPFNTQPEFGVFVVTAGTPGSLPAPTATFTASPASVTSGGAVTLTWSTQNATAASISPGVGAIAISGSITVNPSSSTTYKLTLSGPGGSTEYTTAVTVTGAPPPAPTGTLTAAPASLPTGGGSVTLTWTSQNATSASISNGVGSVSTSGSTTVNVTASTTFKLTLTGSGGTATVNASVTVAGAPPPAPTGTLTASPTSLPFGGGAVTLTWSSQNATSASISPSVGNISTSGSTTVNVTASTTFKLTVNGAGGTATVNASVTVAGSPPPPPTGSITATPSSLPAGGGTVTIAWSSQNATSASIAPGLGAVALSGSATLNVTSSTTFKLTLNGTGGTQSYGAQVTVNSVVPPPSVNLSAFPILLPAGGGQVTLSWTSQGATTASIVGVGTVPVTGSLVVSVTASTGWVLTMSGAGGTGSDTAVAVVLPGPPPPPPPPPGLPKQAQLSQNFPNPFNGGTTIRYVLPGPSYVSMRVYNLLGAVVADLVHEQQGVGYHEVRFNSTNLSSGVYYYIFRAGEYVDMRKMIYLK